MIKTVRKDKQGRLYVQFSKAELKPLHLKPGDEIQLNFGKTEQMYHFNMDKLHDLVSFARRLQLTPRSKKRKS